MYYEKYEDVKANSYKCEKRFVISIEQDSISFKYN